MRFKQFNQSVLLVFITSIFLGTAAAEDTCPSLLARIQSSSKADWEFHHGSTAGILVGSAAILTGTEGLRALHGSESFNQAFLVNSGIDLLVTFIGHQVAMVKLPQKLQAWLNNKTESRICTLLPYGFREMISL